MAKLYYKLLPRVVPQLILVHAYIVSTEGAVSGDKDENCAVFEIMIFHLKDNVDNS